MTKTTKTFLFLYFITSYLLAQTNLIEGYVLLENQNDHSDIQVQLIKREPLPVSGGSIYTNEEGYYSCNFSAGTYSQSFHKDGYFSKTFYPIIINGPTVLDTLVLLEHTTVNPFIQPNDSTLAWYGSGDVDGDNDVDWDDYNSITSIQNDMSDLDGDGISSTVQDKQILFNYINGIIGYLPGQWNKLPTREERISWLDKMLAIDLIDTIPYRSFDDYPNDFFVCGDFSVQTFINFHGYQFANSIEMDSVATRYIVDQNGRFNIPVYYMSFTWPDPYVSHARNAVLVGDNPLNIYDWVYPDQQNYDPINDLRIIGENWNPAPNAYLSIAKAYNPIRIPPNPWSFYIYNQLTFKSESTAILLLSYQNPKLILARPTVSIENETLLIPSKYSLYQNHPNPFNPSTTISYTLPDESDVQIHVYNMLGQQINQLIVSTQPSGSHSIQWNGTNQQGNLVPAGIYFYQLQAGYFAQTKKMVLMK